jgi:hypothetical protein
VLDPICQEATDWFPMGQCVLKEGLGSFIYSVI